MSHNRRPQGGWAPYIRGAWREGRALKVAKLQEDARRDGRRDIEAGDCAACGWITGRTECPMCGAAILEQASHD